jgi:hypothetical protein
LLILEPCVAWLGAARGGRGDGCGHCDGPGDVVVSSVAIMKYKILIKK